MILGSYRGTFLIRAATWMRLYVSCGVLICFLQVGPTAPSIEFVWCPRVPDVSPFSAGTSMGPSTPTK